MARRFSRPSEEVHLAATEPRLAHRRAQCDGRLVVECAEEGRLTQYVVVHGQSFQ
jgi:hypothetical protein